MKSNNVILNHSYLIAGNFIYFFFFFGGGGGYLCGFHG